MIFQIARSLSKLVHSLPQARTMLKLGAYAGVAAVLCGYYRFSATFTALSLFALYNVTGGWRFMRVVFKTLPRDARAFLALLRVMLALKKIKHAGGDVVTTFQDTARKYPSKNAFIMVDGRAWTFREVDEYSNAVANHFYQLGYRKGDVVAMFVESCPEFACLWLGLAKIGVVPALINFNLRNESLAHCINISDARVVIYTADFAGAVRDVKPRLHQDMVFYALGAYDPSQCLGSHLDPILASASTLPPPQEHRRGLSEKLFYIYTSGTTGLPKAAVVIHNRFYYMASSVHLQFGMTSNDVVYDTLPLYHTAGGMLGIGQAFIHGCTVVIRKKFSASRFWDDCIKYNATTAQYIGEICRYLLAQPPKVTDRQHRVRMMYGNGLRPQIWEQFQQRFGIARIGEFYGATEGNANIANTDGKVGAVGFQTLIAPFLYPVTLIKVDEASGQYIRDRNGVCVRCKPGETGELVGKIVKGNPLREFDGYVNPGDSGKKIAENVWSIGDKAFLTGDILEMDELGYLYFKDRTGDTFRWRGENVSTAEVEATVSNIIKLTDSVCYGVEVPGLEGRAGMIAIANENGSLDLDRLYKQLQLSLPAYARPVFVRSLATVKVTSTFKLQKTDYRKEGFDPDKVADGDKLFYLDAKAGRYSPINHSVYNDIRAGKIRL